MGFTGIQTFFGKDNTLSNVSAETLKPFAGRSALKLQAYNAICIDKRYYKVVFVNSTVSLHIMQTFAVS